MAYWIGSMLGGVFVSTLLFKLASLALGKLAPRLSRDWKALACAGIAWALAGWLSALGAADGGEPQYLPKYVETLPHALVVLCFILFMENKKLRTAETPKQRAEDLARAFLEREAEVSKILGAESPLLAKTEER